MTSEQEKALARFLEALSEDCINWATVRSAAKSWKATLEPKPEPKRGVEEILSACIEGWNPNPFKDELREVLGLYREEREWAEKVAREMRERLEPGVGITDWIGRARRWAAELERRG